MGTPFKMKGSAFYGKGNQSPLPKAEPGGFIYDVEKGADQRATYADTRAAEERGESVTYTGDEAKKRSKESGERGWDRVHETRMGIKKGQDEYKKDVAIDRAAQDKLEGKKYDKDILKGATDTEYRGQHEHKVMKGGNKMKQVPNPDYNPKTDYEFEKTEPVIDTDFKDYRTYSGDRSKEGDIKRVKKSIHANIRTNPDNFKKEGYNPTGKPKWGKDKKKWVDDTAKTHVEAYGESGSRKDDPNPYSTAGRKSKYLQDKRKRDDEASKNKK